jgi:16S rRNA (guanine(966)-N(2))-methyltransferase RsmD
MRITGGEARGRRILLPGGSRIRPTSDRIRESLFGILGPLDGVSFLDLFAGSGAVGLEALSRGADSSVFVERQKSLADAIRRNLELLGFSKRGEILAAETERGLGRLSARQARFGILFADPPYGEGYVAKTLKWLERADLLADEGIVVVQHSLREGIDEACPRTLKAVDRRKYGDTVLSFLKSQGAERNL